MFKEISKEEILVVDGGGIIETGFEAYYGGMGAIVGAAGAFAATTFIGQADGPAAEIFCAGAGGALGSKFGKVLGNRIEESLGIYD